MPVRNDMAADLITKRKWFWAWNDEKEEGWLSEMSQQGLHLEGIPFPGSYQFRKGEPGRYTYRLDYQSLKTKDKDSYLQLFSDAGWEIVGEMGGWMYFRYKANNGEPPEIYSDLESKIGKYQRVLGYLVVFLPILVLMMPNIARAEGHGPIYAILGAINFLLMVLFSIGVFQLIRRISRLKKSN